MGFLLAVLNKGQHNGYLNVWLDNGNSEDIYKSREAYQDQSNSPYSIRDK